MTDTDNRDDTSERTFAVLMILLSLLIFLAVLESERRGSQASAPD